MNFCIGQAGDRISHAGLRWRNVDSCELRACFPDGGVGIHGDPSAAPTLFGKNGSDFRDTPAWREGEAASVGADGLHC